MKNKFKKTNSLNTFYYSKFMFFFLFVLVCFSAFSQQNISNLEGKELHNRVRLHYTSVSMPKNEFSNLKPSMGLLGVHYQVPINNWLYGGVGIYAALIGDQGGLFTLGAEIGAQKKLYKNIYLDANIHFGGGGGYRYLVNDGIFINTNIGLQYKKENYSFGVQYSYLNFLTGKIKSNSVSFFVEIPSKLYYTDYKNAQQKFISTNTLTDNFWKKPATKNAQQVRFDFFFPFGESKKDNGAPLTETLYVLGFEYQKYLNDKTFIFAHTDAIYKGLRAGFMDLFLGAGYYIYQSKYANFFTKIAFGAAGGRIAPEGGLMTYPSAGFDVALTNRFTLSSHAGYYRALDGNLEAYTLGFSIKYNSLNGGTITKEKTKHFYTQGIRIGLQNQTYFNAKKTDAPNADLQLIALKFNYNLNKTFYLIGEAGFAYIGKSGGYAHGLVGIGIDSPYFLNEKMNAFAEITGGAGGGAGIDTGEGVILRPTIGFNYNFSSKFAITASVGKIMSPFSNLNNTTTQLGVNFNLATLTANKI